jgi:AsmA family protein
MNEFLRKHVIFKWTVVSVAGFVAVLAIALSLFDWNVLRAPLARLISAKTGFPTSIDGNLYAHVWSWDPLFRVEDLSIENRQWPGRQKILSVKRITVQVSLGRLLLGNLVLPRMELDSPIVNLERDGAGRANWSPESRSSAPANVSPHVPAIRRLIIRDGKIHMVDRVRKLRLDGTLAADERAKTKDDAAFQLRCTGSLNERPFRFHADGGPLINVDPNEPYTFTVDAKAADISLALQASIPKPFDLAAYQAKFVLSGADLADAYYLTNLALPNSSSYRLQGTLQHHGDIFQIDDFRGSVGSSDLSGKLSVTVGKVRPKLVADLTSTRLNIADLAPAVGSGLPVKQSMTANGAGRSAAADTASKAQADAAAASQTGWLLPDADLQVNRVRGMDADVRFRAQSVVSAKVPLRHLQFHLILQDGVLNLDPLSFALPEGQMAGTVRINAAPAVPVSDIDMRLQNIDLAQFKGSSAKVPPLEGTMAGRIKLHGTGESVHKFASSADGSLSIAVPHGQIRAALAEFMGINVARGLGLLLAKNQQQSELRCGVAAFQADQGHLYAKTIVMDTTNVLVTGHGGVDLHNERLDLALQGNPKKFRLLHLHSPVKLEGTLENPKVGIDPEKTLLQAGEGTVLGALLSPIAAVLAFIDVGLAKNADCSALLAQAAPSGSGAKP